MGLFSSREAFYWSPRPTTLKEMRRCVDRIVRDEIDGVAHPNPIRSFAVNGGFFTAMRTDARGRFRFEGLADGRYVLGLMLDGRRSVEVEGAPAEVIHLRPQAPRFDAGDIRVTSRRAVEGK